MQNRSVSDSPLWSAIEPVNDLTIANLSAAWANRGMCSQISIPETFVAIGSNSPRNSRGASGFRSNMSWCEGPPLRWILIRAL